MRIVLSAREHKQILSDAKELYLRVMSNTGAPPEKLWGWSAPHMKKYWDKLDEGLKTMLFYAQEEPHIAYNHEIYSQPFGFVVEDMLSYLKTQEFDIAKAPRQIQETELTSPKIKFRYHGRTLSTDFLYRLAIVKSIESQIRIADLKTVLEIGAGLGTLARCLKLFNSKLKYFIIDLPETLVFSYCFLRANFPNLPVKYVTSLDELGAIGKEHFVFIPAHFALKLPKLTIDLAINNYSLGEMPQATVLDYMKLIQEKLDVRYLYSLNRYLQDFRINRAGIVSLPLDEYWMTRKWVFCPLFCRIDRILIPTDHRSTLEVLMERIPKAQRDHSQSVISARTSFKAAQDQEIHGHRWQRLMWESIRLCPTRKNLEPYVKYLGDAQCSEYPYYLRMLRRLGGKTPTIVPESAALLSGKQPVPRHPYLDLIRRVGGAVIDYFSPKD